MKHAGATTLDTIKDLLAQIRTLAIEERKPGIFYRKRDAFLHFHEDPAGLFADVKVEGQWQRLPADTEAQRRKVVAAARKAAAKPA